jgi:release factor glutamine methyltransferase
VENPEGRRVTREQAISRLRAAGCVFAEDEADVLFEAAAAAKTAGGAGGPLAVMVERRAAGEPLEHVVGYADFAGVRVRLRPGVFVPRVRSTLLVRLAVAEIRPGALVVDLCCGSGALGMAVRHRVPGITLHAADVDPAAVACARDNLTENVHQGDLFRALPEALRGRIGLLLANVPYVATTHIPFLPAEARDHEPPTALDGGDDGLTVFRAVAAGARDWLAPGGLLISEITEAQSPAASTIADGNGLTADVVTDDDLDARAILARRPR